MSKEKPKTRILIVEDHPIFRMGMSELINQEDDLEICGQAEDVAGARKAVAELAPDMLIVDLSLKDSSGLDLVKEMSLARRDMPVLVLSMHEETLHAQRCLKAGARGYIMKQEASASVIKAIHRILQGEVYVGQRVMNRILDAFASCAGAPRKSPLDHLSDRELEVFRLIGKGMSTGGIARRLNLSARTVGTYRERIKEKLGLKDGGELMRSAVLWVERAV